MTLRTETHRRLADTTVVVAQHERPPTPGSSVTTDPENAGMVTPKRAQVFTATPADDDKKAGSHAGHPVNLP